MTSMTRVSTFTYDEAVATSNAAVRGYSTLRGLYSRPGRAEKFLRKRLNERFDNMNLIYAPGAIYSFTVKGRRYKIYVLILPYADGRIPEFVNIVREGNLRQYRFFDTLDEALHARALRELQEREPKDLGHLRHKALS